MRQLCFRSLSQILSNDQNPNLEPIAARVPTVSVSNQILLSYHFSLDQVPQDFSRSLYIV